MKDQDFSGIVSAIFLFFFNLLRSKDFAVFWSVPSGEADAHRIGSRLLARTHLFETIVGFIEFPQKRTFKISHNACGRKADRMLLNRERPWVNYLTVISLERLAMTILYLFLTGTSLTLESEYRSTQFISLSFWLPLTHIINMHQNIHII